MTKPSEYTAERFRRNGYAALRGLLAGPALVAAYEYALDAARGPRATLNDFQVPGTPTLAADPMTEALLEKLWRRLERLSGLALLPTYSFMRIYKRGDVLTSHLDRPACEISLSLSLGYEAKEPWRLWLQSRGRTTSVSLEAGDALLYRGTQLPHWRRAFDGRVAAQVFLHYVVEGGRFAHLKFDGRERLTSPADGERLPAAIEALDVS
jgi:alkylated DNA repair dioxygenase AlkB